jgi:hypothetical protein
MERLRTTLRNDPKLTLSRTYRDAFFEQMNR